MPFEYNLTLSNMHHFCSGKIQKHAFKIIAEPTLSLSGDTEEIPYIRAVPLIILRCVCVCVCVGGGGKLFGGTTPRY